MVHGRATGTVVSAGKAVGADNVAGATVGAWHIGTLPPLWPRWALPATVVVRTGAWPSVTLPPLWPRRALPAEVERQMLNVESRRF